MSILRVVLNIKKKCGERSGPGAVATAHALDKFTRTIDANVAAVNGFKYMPVAIEKDSLTLGPKMGTLIKDEPEPGGGVF